MTTQRYYYEISSCAPSGGFGTEGAPSMREARDTARWLRANGYTNIQITKVWR